MCLPALPGFFSAPRPLIITHRFTTAMQADMIHVMDTGQIVESGSHQELLAQGGRYAESWRAQMNSEKMSSHTRELAIRT